VPRRKGVSPVIATVIIVAVTIAVAIAVAFWMSGLVGLFTATEKVEIPTAYATSTDTGWTVTITVKNTGTIPTSIDNVFINGVPYSDCVADGTVTVTVNPDVAKAPLALNPGGEDTLEITITRDGTCGVTTFKPGIGVEIKLHSSGGKEYPKLITLP